MTCFILTWFQNFRRIRPVSQIQDDLENEIPVKNVCDTVSDVPPAKRFKSESEITGAENECDLLPDSSEWKWSISDFRKKHSENSKEQLEDPKKLSKEQLNQSKQLLNDPKEPSVNSKEPSGNSNQSPNIPEECEKHFLESSENSKESVKSSKQDFGENLNSGSHLKNLSHVTQYKTQSWKLPVRSFKEQASDTRADTNKTIPDTNQEGKTLINEPKTDNMPVILNVYSLSQGPEKQLPKTNQDNVFSTPPCSPPFVQLGAFNAIPVSNQNPRYRYQNTFQNGRDNWHRPVQQYYNNFQEYVTNPVQQVSSQPKQVYYNYSGNTSYPVKPVGSNGYQNKPLQQVYSNYQGIIPKRVQQLSSKEYQNKQVYYYQENISYPQQANPQEYLNKPVQQVYYNPPPDYLSKPVQPVYNHQEFRHQTVQQTNLNPPEYRVNPSVQKVNPIDPQDYVYNAIQHNPEQIANGVLPFDKPSSSTYEIQGNTGQFYTQLHYNYSVNDAQQLSSQPRRISTDNCLVATGNSTPTGNGFYGRFKLKQPMNENNKTSSIQTQIFQATTVKNGSENATLYSGVTQNVSNPANELSTAEVISNVPPAVENRENLPININNDVKYKTENPERNITFNKITPTNNNIYYVKEPDGILNNPTNISENQSFYSEKPFCTSTIYIPRARNEVEKGDNPQELLSSRDSKVKQLKQRFEEQVATINKLKANH